MDISNELTCPAPLQLWGGVECTVNRVRDRYYDQLERSGHLHRLEDLHAFAALRLRALRYPLLWERFAPDGRLDAGCWRWADERMAKLRALEIRPIIGLVHHGSGPAHTSLVSDNFAADLAEYAGRVAARYPWAEDWTPVNEPLTTARFSGLYGHWHPHGTSESIFARALVNQCRGIILAMQAVRRVNPAARLIQTDDLGKVYSTPRLRYQADFENERRWLAWDLLCGLVDRYHRMWGHLQWCGIAEAELHWFLDNACPPDVIGINHYLTSERFLDERCERYPADAVGDNGTERYADVEAIRVLHGGTPGIGAILQEAWNRYGRPLAITEVHLGCWREEQMRWFAEVWAAAQRAQASGIDVRAVTAWSLLGAYDWNSLLTRFENSYETGVFDVRSGKLRPTALAALLRQIGAGKTPDHPVLAQHGWWRQPSRLIYPAENASGLPLDWEQPPASTARPDDRPVLVAGASGALGYAVCRLCHMRNITHVGLTRAEMDIADAESIRAAFDRYKPWAVINAAGFAGIDEAEGSPERCWRENVAGPSVLAGECARYGIPLVTLSSDMVFDGSAVMPYCEGDLPAPVNTYGRAKANCEEAVFSALPEALIVRTGMLFGPWDGANSLTRALSALAVGREIAVPNDTVGSPTYIPDLAHAVLDLLLDGAQGRIHLANQGAVTPEQLIRMAAACSGAADDRLYGVPVSDLGLAAARPRYTVLGTNHGQILQPLDKAIACYVRDAAHLSRSCRPFAPVGA